MVREAIMGMLRPEQTARAPLKKLRVYRDAGGLARHRTNPQPLAI